MDATAVTFLDDWIANTNTLITMESGSSHSYVVHAAKLSGHNVDLASEDGVFIELPFQATATGSGKLMYLKLT